MLVGSPFHGPVLPLAGQKPPSLFHLFSTMYTFSGFSYLLESLSPSFGPHDILCSFLSTTAGQPCFSRQLENGICNTYKPGRMKEATGLETELSEMLYSGRTGMLHPFQERTGLKDSRPMSIVQCSFLQKPVGTFFRDLKVFATHHG